MWREYDEQGFLVYSFAETMAAMYPYYVMRAFGGTLYLGGALVMAYNIYKTIRGGAPVAVNVSVATVQAAE
jgi:cytochrome c oxidase cbb3-type subunit I